MSRSSAPPPMAAPDDPGARPVVITVRNHHVPQCGTPPVIDWEHVQYSAYYESRDGEQWIVWQDEAGVHLAGGDCGWDQVRTYPLELLQQSPLRTGLVLDQGERLWLSAVLTTIRTIAFGYGAPVEIVEFVPPGYTLRSE